jgi:hypothetical protein
MKKLLLSIIMLLELSFVYAQTQKSPPPYFNYQAILRDKDGKILGGKKVVVEFKILKYNGFSFDTERAETHTSVTSDLGLINLYIGKGSLISGLPFKAISAINWADSILLGITVTDGQTGQKIIEPTIQNFASTPYTLFAQNSSKADTAKVALALAGLGGDINGKFVGAVQIFGMNEGATIIKGSEWQQVTRTIYDRIETLFGSNGNMNNNYNPIATGTKREYYLVIRKGDNVDICAGAENLGRNAMGSEWRFYLDWKEKSGHKFQLGRNWGGGEQGSMDWIKIPPMSSYPEFSHPMYWRLEARMNPNCPNVNMKVHSIYVVAYDKAVTSATDTVKVNIDIDNRKGNESVYELGIKGGVQITPSRYVRILGSDLMLGTEDGRSIGNIPHQRALVHDNGDVLKINYAGDFEGGVRVEGPLLSCKVLEVTGGDVAEARHSTTGEQLLKGSVVVFDEIEKRKIRLTNKPYDKKVAGVISGAGIYYAGITLLQEELQKGAMPVAQIGTVEVLTIGPVEVGDLLTTSEVEGYAKAATDVIKGIGCVIGKATTTLKEGERGLVEMQIEKH